MFWKIRLTKKLDILFLPRANLNCRYSLSQVKSWGPLPSRFTQLQLRGTQPMVTKGSSSQSAEVLFYFFLMVFSLLGMFFSSKNKKKEERNRTLKNSRQSFPSSQDFLSITEAIFLKLAKHSFCHKTTVLLKKKSGGGWVFPFWMRIYVQESDDGEKELPSSFSSSLCIRPNSAC